MKFMNIELKKYWFYLGIILLLFVLSLYFRLIKWSNFEGFTPSSIIINPNFSIPDISANSYKYISDLSTITGWTFSGNTGNTGTLITNGQNPWNNSTPPPGTTQALSIQQSSGGNYTVSQPLTLTPGTYNVKFYARPRPGNVSQKMTASLNGSSVSTEFSPSDGWILYSLSTIITTQSTYPLSFLFSADSNDTSISLTGINIIQTPPTPTPTPTPTPPTIQSPTPPTIQSPIPTFTTLPSTSSTSTLPVPISTPIPSTPIPSTPIPSSSSSYTSIYRQLNQF